MKELLHLCGILGLMWVLLFIFNLILSTIFSIMQTIESHSGRRKLIAALLKQTMDKTK